MFLRTENLYLTPRWDEEGDELASLRDPDEPPRDKAALARDWPRPDDISRLSINLRTVEGPRLIGAIGIGKPGSETPIGFWLARSHRRKGYGREALRAVVDVAPLFGHSRFCAVLGEDGEEQIAAFEAAGFMPAKPTETATGGRSGAFGPLVRDLSAEYA